MLEKRETFINLLITKPSDRVSPMSLKSKLKSMTVKELESLADEKEISLSGARLKNDKINAIIESGKIDEYYFEEDAEEEPEEEAEAEEDGQDDEGDRIQELEEKGIDNMLKDELIEYADLKNIDVSPSMLKDEIIEAIEEGVEEEISEKETEEEVEESPEEEWDEGREEEVKEDLVFDEMKFEKALDDINKELEVIGAHITKTLGKIAGIDEITQDEMELIDDNIKATSHVSIDFQDATEKLDAAQKEYDNENWRSAFENSVEALTTMKRQEKGFKKVALARALESCENLIDGYPPGTDGIARLEHDLLHAKLLFSKDDTTRIIEIIEKVSEEVRKLPEPEDQNEYCDTCGSMLEEGATYCTGCGAPVKKKETVPKKGTCKKCGSKDLVFYKNGTGECPDCGRKFVWKRKKPKKKLMDFIKRS